MNPVPDLTGSSALLSSVFLGISNLSSSGLFSECRGTSKNVKSFRCQGGMWIWKLHKINFLQALILESHDTFLAQLPFKTAVIALLSEYSQGYLFEQVFRFPQRPQLHAKGSLP